MTAFKRNYQWVFIILLLISCGKETDKKTPIDTDLSLVNDVHRLEEESIRAFYMLEHIEQYNKTPISTFPTCATIVFDTVNTTTKKVTIDFGNGCKCEAMDGKFRKGKLEIEWDGNYFEENGKRSLKSVNYFVGNGSKYYQVNLDMNVTTNSYLHFSSSENITFFKNNVDKITRNATKTYRWNKGKDTYNNLYDDIIYVYGNGNGQNIDDKTFTTSVAENQSIVLDLSCKWLKDGILYINPENKNQRKVDYTVCDSYANVDIQGRVYTINFLSLD